MLCHFRLSRYCHFHCWRLTLEGKLIRMFSWNPKQTNCKKIFWLCGAGWSLVLISSTQWWQTRNNQHQKGRKRRSWPRDEKLGSGYLQHKATKPAGRKIFDVLPLTTSFNTWGDEIYFSIPVDSPLDETSKEVVEIGDLGYWPPGSAFCILFAMTSQFWGGVLMIFPLPQ